MINCHASKNPQTLCVKANFFGSHFEMLFILRCFSAQRLNFITHTFEIPPVEERYAKVLF